MKFATLLGEAVRNALSGTSRTVLFALGFGVILSMPIAGDALTARTLVDDAVEFQNSGSSIVTIVAPGAIDGTSCQALNHVANVRSAGAVRKIESKFVFSVVPRSPAEYYETTHDFPLLDGVRTSGLSGVYVSSELLDTLGAKTHQTDSSFGVVDIRGAFTYPADGRRPGFGWAVLSPVASQGNFDECWVEMWPYSNEMRSILLTSVSASATRDAKVTVSQVNLQHGNEFRGVEQFDSRFTRLNPIFCLLLGAVASFFAVRIRRLELASRLHDGASHRSLRVLMLIETAGWLLPGAAIALGVTAASLLGTPAPDSLELFVNSSVCVICAVGGGVFGSLIGTALIKEEDLFLYFKDR